MPRLDIVTQFIGEVDVSPRQVFITTSFSYEDVVSPGFLKQTKENQFYTTDVVNVFYSYSELTKSGVYGQFVITFDGTTIILVPAVNNIINGATLPSDDSLQNSDFAFYVDTDSLKCKYKGVTGTVHTFTINP
jgi:hypothetical protein